MESTSKLISLFLLLVFTLGISLFMFYKLGLMEKFFPDTKLPFPKVATAKHTPTPTQNPKSQILNTKVTPPVSPLTTSPAPAAQLGKSTSSRPKPSTSPADRSDLPTDRSATSRQSSAVSHQPPASTNVAQLQSIRSIPTAGSPTIWLPLMGAVAALGISLRSRTKI